jgi:hypothetical protein
VEIRKERNGFTFTNLFLVAENKIHRLCTQFDKVLQQKLVVLFFFLFELTLGTCAVVVVLVFVTSSVLKCKAFWFGQSQTVLSLTNVIEKSNNILNVK